MDVRGFFAPFEEIAFLHLDLLPHLGAAEHIGIFFLEHFGFDAGSNRFIDLLLCGPQILKIDGLPIRTDAQRFVVQIDIHRAGKSIRHDQRR